MFAKVIIDVPAKQTNRAFDYVIPSELEQWIEVGSRVGVPFGPRNVQGFVVDIHTKPGMDPKRIKPIKQVLDAMPPLTQELVELGKWMSEKYLCYEVVALQAMLPGALKAKYERNLQVVESVVQDTDILLPQEEAILQFVRRKGRIKAEQLQECFANEGKLVRDLVERGMLTESQQIKDRISTKKKLTVFPPEDLMFLKEAEKRLSSRAAKQKEVLRYLLEHPEPVHLTELITRLDISASTVKALADKEIIELNEQEVMRDPYAGRHFTPTAPLPLTREQAEAFAQIHRSLTEGRHQVFLIHGVTGSGKTEVYLQSIQTCLEQGREAIVLVPEISLTPQLVERFKGRFGDQVAVLHSRLSQGERFDEWKKIARHEVKVAIGARSAIFAPFRNIGIIIMDEEHESSYKQEESPKYHARDIAIERAKKHGASVLLGSATPSLESMYLATNRKDGEEPAYCLLSMKTRVAGRPLPPVSIVDMREELKNGNRSMFSRLLRKAIEERLSRNEQTVLLLNRRGYATFVMCRTCGFVAQCPHCDISLTYHQHSRTLRCHYCGYAEREMRECPDCGSEHIRHFGTGTQRVEKELVKLFPGIRVIRMDVDTTSEKGSHEKWLNLFANKQADILLGTQMVAKGLDFPDVTLVGVIAADTVLNLPDFRSSERTFQLLTQVAGRAGRHTLPGEVFVQTYTPDHYSILAAAEHDYIGFAREELGHRRIRAYPPYHKLILVTLSHEQPALLIRAAESFAARLRELAKLEENQPGKEAFYMEVLGPVASPISRIKDRYRFQCVIKYENDAAVSRLVRQAVAAFDEQTGKNKLQISVDVDPQFLM